MTHEPPAKISPTTGPLWPDDPFWHYSLGLYPRLREAALALQDQAGADVNLMLFCVWTAASGRGALSRKEMAAALAAVRPWQRDVVQPLRAARRFVSGWQAPAGGDYAQALRVALLDNELAAERVAHILLSAVLDGRAPGTGADPADAPRDGLENLRLYLDMAGILLDIDSQKALHDFWRAAFPQG